MPSASITLIFDSGETSHPMRVLSQVQLDAACRVMLAEQQTAHAHRLRLERAEGGAVTIRARAA
jgi:hypothetical protein